MEETRALRHAELDETGEFIFSVSWSTVLAAAAGLKPTTRTGIYFAASRILSLLRSGEMEGIAHACDGAIDGLILWQELPWDTEVTKARCARIVMAAGRGLPAMFEMWNGEAARRGVEYTTMRIPEGHSASLEKGDLLASAGFGKLERIIYLAAFTGIDPKAQIRQDAPVKLRKAVKEDIEEIGRMAARSYSYDRFHKDSFFSREAADAVHVKWIRDSFAGRADAILVATGEGGAIDGYCTLMLPKGPESFSGWIDMLAVDSGRRHLGIGEALMRGALAYIHDAGVLSAALCTQDDNKPGLNLYQKTGFDQYLAAITWRKEHHPDGRNSR